MNLSAAKAVFGLSALFNAARPGVTWAEPIGSSAATTTQLPLATSGFEVRGFMGDSGHTFSVHLSQGGGYVTGAANAASSIFSMGAAPTVGEVVTIGTRTYTFVSALTTANQVLIGVDEAATKLNLVAAIMGAAGAGTVYGNGTVAHSQVDAVAGSFGNVQVEAKTAGFAGNSIATTTTAIDASWTNTTLEGGCDAAAVQFGGDNKDPEGTDLGDIDMMHGLSIDVVQGAAHVTIYDEGMDANICDFGVLDSGGGVQVRIPAGNDTMSGDGATTPRYARFTATEPNTIVDVTMLGRLLV